jgi:excisionase family DNA binding protein
MTIVEARAAVRTEWMSSREASSLMGVSSATLRRWSDAGRIRTFTTLGGHRRFSRTAVADLLAADTAGGPSTGASRERMRSVDELASSTRLEPAAGRALRMHARRIATALVASTDAATADARAFVLGDAESSAAAWGAVAARSGLGLRETVEALLDVLSSSLRALVDEGGASADRGPTPAATMELLSGTFDRLICRAMRAHEAASRGG